MMGGLKNSMWRRGLLALAVGLGWFAVAHASTWRSALYPETWLPPDESVSFYTDKLIQDFSYAGYRRGEEALPEISGPVFNVSNYGADASGATDSTAAIQAAIDAAAAAGGGVVYLPPGEFRVAPQGDDSFALRIASSNVVLRGAGTGETFLLNTSHEMRGKAVIQISPLSSSTGSAVSISADLPGPTRQIPVANAAAFAPGDFVRMQWTFTEEWIAEHNQQTFWNANARPADARYYREVMATNPTEGWIEVDVPTRYAMWVRDDARVYRQTGFISEVGVEDLSIGNLQHPGTGFAENDYTDPTKAAYDTHASWLIRMSYLRDSWISNVHSFRAASNTSTAHMLSNGISLVNCLRITVRDSQMRRAQYGGGGGNGYMFRVQHSNECLIADSVAEFSRHGFVISHAGTSGNVFLRCEDRETARATGNTGSYNTSGSGSDHHMHFSHSNLFDQCHVHDSFFTAHHRQRFGTVPHALTSAHGVYWNTTGSGTRGGSIVRSEQGRYGYVIGTSGSRSTASNPTGGGTAPADHLEGIGLGATLEPASLYFDQLELRLQPMVIYHANGATAGSAPVDTLGPYDAGDIVTVLGPGDLSRTHFTFAGWNTAADGSGIDFAPDSSFSIIHRITLHAQWDYLMQVDAGPDQAVALASTIPWTPALRQTAAWYDAADSSTLLIGADTLAQWGDKSGNSHHALQRTLANRPVTGLATIGGLATVSFRAAQQQSLLAPDRPSLNLDPAGGGHIFAVFHPHGWVDQGSALNAFVSKGLLIAPLAGYGISISNTNSIGFKPGVGTQLESGSAWQGQPLLVTASRDDESFSSDLYLNGRLRDSVITENAIVSANTNDLILGADPSVARFSDVDMGEVLILGGVLSTEEREQFEGYLAHKWGLAGNLPLGHPYRAMAPFVGFATADLSGSATGGVGDFLTHTWSLVSGPAPVAFADPTSLDTSVSFSRIGVYTVRLTSTDTVGSSFAEAVLTVGYESAQSAFEAWSGNGGLSFDGDANGDGVADGLAWLLGARNPFESAENLLPVGLVNPSTGEVEFIFSVLNEAARGSAPVKLLYSTDLRNWSSLPVPAEGGTFNGVEFIITADGTVNNVVAILPQSPGAISSTVFVRLSGALEGEP
jgi:hypothetical protein